MPDAWSPPSGKIYCHVDGSSLVACNLESPPLEEYIGAGVEWQSGSGWVAEWLHLGTHPSVPESVEARGVAKVQKVAKVRCKLPDLPQTTVAMGQKLQDSRWSGRLGSCWWSQGQYALGEKWINWPQKKRKQFINKNFENLIPEFISVLNRGFVNKSNISIFTPGHINLYNLVTFFKDYTFLSN